ncbi:unnamed protein product [Rotaria magnacalcarata]
MESSLCFHLCEAPIIYIQQTVCRCSGGGLMHRNRQRDSFCSIPCRKSGDRLMNTIARCGGTETYSAYAEDQFYTRHAHLFEYRIQFSSCELWNNSGYYDTLYLFNRDANQYLCIISEKLNVSDRKIYSTILPYSSCDHYCDNALVDSYVEHKFKCGSLTDSRIWALYHLSDLCSTDSVYMKDYKECLSSHKGYSNICPSSLKYYI